MTIRFSNPAEEGTTQSVATNSTNAATPTPGSDQDSSAAPTNSTNAATSTPGNDQDSSAATTAPTPGGDQDSSAAPNAASTHTAGMNAGESAPRAGATYQGADYGSADYDERRKEIGLLTYDLLYYACRLSDLYDYRDVKGQVTIPVDKLSEIIAEAQMSARRAADELAAYSMELEDLADQAAAIAASKIAAQGRTLKQYAQELEATKKALTKERESSSNSTDLYGYLYCMVADRLTNEDRRQLGEFNRALYQKRHKRS